MSKGFTHEAPYTGETVVWLTPPHILKALGSFDLDPCSALDRPWDTAERHYTILDNGLSQPWYGRCWVNSPYGPDTGKWLQKTYEHGNGIALVFARTETKAFQQWVWGKADAMLFIFGRLKFHKPDGTRGESAGAPSVLIAYGENNVEILRTCGIPGAFIDLRNSKGGKDEDTHS